MSSRTSSSLWYRVFLMTVVVGGLALPAGAQKCWSAIGSTAVINNASTGVANQVGINLGVASTAPLPAVVAARYAVSGIQDDAGSTPNGKIMFVRFVDNGTQARVKLSFRQMNVLNEVGGTEFKAFDSDELLPSTASQIVYATTPCSYGGGFNLVAYNYFIVVEITKSDPGGNPLLQLVQVCERAGLPAPYGC